MVKKKIEREQTMKLKLGDVGTTALIPLSNRASETKRKNPRVQDPKAVEIIEALGVDTKNYDKLVTHECVIARTIMFDEEVKRLIGEYSEAVCVNMGCGLDDRFERVDNEKIRWFDVDLPDSIAVRKKVYEETDRRRMLAGGVTETAWIPAVKKAAGEKTVIFIAEGLFMYFSKEEQQAILHNLVSEFDSGYLLVEMMRPSMMDEKKHETVKHTGAKFGWGTKSGKEFEDLEPRLRLIGAHSFSEQMKKSTLVSRIVGVLAAKINNRLAVFRWGNF